MITCQQHKSLKRFSASDIRKTSCTTLASYEMKTKKTSIFDGFASKVKNTFKTKRGAVSRVASAYSLNEPSFYETNNLYRKKFSIPSTYGRKSSCRFITNKESSSTLSSYSSDSFSSGNSSPEMKRAYSYGEQSLKRMSRKNRKQAKLSDNEINNTKSKSKIVKLAVLGGEEVGKSAFVVRYLTKRFIGDYVPETESVYDHATNIAGKDVSLTLWETMIPNSLQTKTISQNRRTSLSSISSNLSVSSNEEFVFNIKEDKKKHHAHFQKPSLTCDECTCTNSPKINERVDWADGLIVLYNIGDKQSFEQAQRLVSHVRCRESCLNSHNRDSGVYSSNSSNAGSLPRSCVSKSQQIPIILVGNKADLIHRRQVAASCANTFAVNNDCTFTELSVSESFQPTCDTITTFITSLRKFKSSNSLKRIVRNSRR